MIDTTIGVLRAPAAQQGDYLATLHAWGHLPERLPIPDTARLLAHLTRQNFSALQKIILDAVRLGDCPVWGLSHHGHWVEGMHRVILPYSAKPRIKVGANGTTMKIQLGNIGKPHIEAMAVKPIDVIGLLIKRGRKVPDELRELLPELGAECSKSPQTAVPSAPPVRTEWEAKKPQQTHSPVQATPAPKPKRRDLLTPLI